jgi:hypothetical protein
MMHKYNNFSYNNFHAQMESVAGPKKNFPLEFQTARKKKKNVAGHDFWRLTPSKWPSSQNTGYSKF